MKLHLNYTTSIAAAKTGDKQESTATELIYALNMDHTGRVEDIQQVQENTASASHVNFNPDSLKDAIDVAGDTTAQREKKSSDVMIGTLHHHPDTHASIQRSAEDISTFSKLGGAHGISTTSNVTGEILLTSYSDVTTEKNSIVYNGTEVDAIAVDLHTNTIRTIDNDELQRHTTTSTDNINTQTSQNILTTLQAGEDFTQVASMSENASRIYAS